MARGAFRQFHAEGFVNQYVLDPSSTPERAVFTSESIENIPAGFRARETYVFAGRDQLEETFEIEEPWKDVELYSRNRLTRVKEPGGPMDRKRHWEHVYETKGAADVSWYQAEPETSLRLLDAGGLTADS